MLRQIKPQIIGWLFSAIICYWILSYGGFQKYLFVLLIALCGIGIKRNRISQKYFIILTIPICYFLTGILCAIVKLNISKFSLKVSCFVFIPAIAAICIFNTMREKDIRSFLDIQFWAISIISLIIGSASLKQGRLFESQYAFILGAYTIYYYAFKRARMLCIAAMFTFLANKRIVLAAVIACIILYTLILHFKNHQISKWIVNGVIFTALFMCYIWVACVKNGTLLKFFSMLHIESNGRINVWNQFSEYYQFSPSYLGNGIGSVVSYLDYLQIPGFANLHNDLLLIFIETGFWGFGLCIFSYFYIVIRSNSISGIPVARRFLLISLISFSFINYMTDNTLIYINYWLPEYLMILGILFAPLDYRKGKDDVNSKI